MKKLANKVYRVTVVLTERDYLKLKRWAKVEDKRMSQFIRENLAICLEKKQKSKKK